MIRPNIIKIPSRSDWLLTFVVLDPDSELPASPENAFVKFKLYDGTHQNTPIWSGSFDDGIQRDPVKPGVVHIIVPRSISDNLPDGIYTFELDVESKSNPSKVKKDSGTIEAVKLDPTGGIEFGTADNVARRMVGNETLRAMMSEEKLREDISSVETEIQPGSIDTDKLADGAVTTQKIATHAVTADKIAPGAIPEPKVSAESITTDKIADEAVTREKIAAGVLPDPIPNDSVSSVKIQTGAVTSDKIAAGAVTPDKLAAGSISSDMLQDGSIPGRKIADNSIGHTKLDPTLIANIDSLAQAFLPLIKIGTVTSGSEFSVSPRFEDGYLFFDFTLVPGESPVISENNTWVVSGIDSEIPVRGEDGVGVDRVVLTSVANGVATYTMYFQRGGHPVDYSYPFTLPWNETTDLICEESEALITSGTIYKNEVYDRTTKLLATDHQPLSINTCYVEYEKETETPGEYETVHEDFSAGDAEVITAHQGDFICTNTPARVTEADRVNNPGIRSVKDILTTTELLHHSILDYHCIFGVNTFGLYDLSILIWMDKKDNLEAGGEDEQSGEEPIVHIKANGHLGFGDTEAFFLTEKNVVDYGFGVHGGSGVGIVLRFNKPGYIGSADHAGIKLVIGFTPSSLPLRVFPVFEAPICSDLLNRIITKLNAIELAKLENN